MISVVYKKDHSLCIFGHANFADYGKDIVCASVSSIVITTINAMIRINENSVECIQKENEISVKIIGEDETQKKLLQNAIDLLNELSHQYPKNIKIREED